MVWGIVALQAQDGLSPSASDGNRLREAARDLDSDQQRLADRFARLESIALRLAELTAATSPRRAKLLREAIAKSREQAVSERFATIVALLEEGRLSAAVRDQADLKQELESLLELLLTENRDEQLTSEKRRLRAYLKRIKQIIRQQQGLGARTEQDEDAPQLAKLQQRVADETEKLAEDVAKSAAEGTYSSSDK